MVVISGHLSIEELEERYLSCSDVRSSRHFQTIWLLAKGRSVCEVGEVVGFVPRWIDELVVRYNANGPAALGDLRRHNGAQARVLTPRMLERLGVRLADPPDDGGVWTSKKVATWLAGELGLVSVGVQRGWEALQAVGWSVQKPRPKNPKAATPQEAEAFKKTLPLSSRTRRANIQER
jgi:transposase